MQPASDFEIAAIQITLISTHTLNRFRGDLVVSLPALCKFQSWCYCDFNLLRLQVCNWASHFLCALRVCEYVLSTTVRRCQSMVRVWFQAVEVLIFN